MVALAQLPDDMQLPALDLLAAVQDARARTARNRAADRETDARRRKLVGARLPRAVADRVTAAAAAEGLSVYEWTRNAIMAALTAAEQPPWDPGA